MCHKKKSLEEMINQQSTAIRSTSNTKQHKFISQLCTNTRPLALDRQTTTATESGTTATTKHAILLSTYHHLRVAQLTAGGTCIIQPSRPRGRSHLQCCCVAFPGAVIVITTTSSSFSHACACHVYIHVCMYVYLPKFSTSKQMHNYDPYRSTMGILYSNIIICFGTKNDANLE